MNIPPKREIIKYIKDIWNHSGFQKYLQNTGWMFAAQISAFCTSFFAVAIVARYLGPSNLGELNYAQSFVTIISVFASLGIDQILFRDLIKDPEKENVLLGTAIYSKFVLGILAFLLAISISVLIHDSVILTILIGICSLTFVVNPIGTVAILFNARVKAKYSSHVAIFLAFFIPALKILVIFLKRGIIYFAIIIFIQVLISVLWYLYIYIVHLKNSPSLWKFNPAVFKQLMRDSWPLILAAFSSYVYANVDQVLILHYINSATVGIYGAAVKLTQVWAFLPGLLITSLFPAIINAKKISFASYARRFRLLFVISVGSMILIALPLFVFAPLAIHIVFGDAFAAAVPILRVYLWVSISITLLVLSQQFLVAENFTKIFFYSALTGAISNIILNVVLIPLYGSYGSAWATMTSYSLAFISIFFFKESREGICKIFGPLGTQLVDLKKLM